MSTGLAKQDCRVDSSATADSLQGRTKLEFPPAGPRPRRLLLLSLLTALVAGGGSGAAVATLVAPTSGVATRPSPTLSAGQFPDIPAIVRSVNASVVAIDVTIRGVDPFGRLVERRSSGTGFIFTGSGLIATNAHVVGAANGITVTFADGTSAAGQLLGADPAADLAVIRTGRTGLTPVPLGSSATIPVGVSVVALGNALSLGRSLTASLGIVSALDRSITTSDGRTYSGLIQTDAAINPGDSGGPLIDSAGQVVGVNTAGATSAENIGFAIPIDQALPILTRLAGGAVTPSP